MKLKPRVQNKLNMDTINMLSAELNLSTTTAKILFMRGCNTVASAKEYLGLNGVKFSNPFDIAGVMEAIDRIQYAIDENKHITIFSDYDADGVCGCSIFLKKFKELKYNNVDYYVPNREGEGYGLNKTAIDKIKNKDTSLIITVDCGISNVEEIAYAKSLGMDVIVTDHHNCPPELPECILVNPKLGCADGQQNLCGAAVAMKVCQALGGGSAFNQGMELAAIATVADMMPLKGENKHIVNQGLEIINHNPSFEIKTLVKSAINKDSIDSEDIAFKLGPIINAAGRISSAHVGVELLSARTATPLEDAQSMIEQNELRKEIQNTVYIDALKMLTADELRNQRCIVLYKESWPIGVVGIAASKLMKSFGRPIALLGNSEGKIKGSLRSVDGINIFDILIEMNELFDSFGGHSKAAGITLHDGKFDEFKYRFQNAMFDYDKAIFDNTLFYDAICSANEVNLDLVHELSLMKPFGQDNPAVSVLLKDMTIANYRTMGKDSNHYSAAFKDSTGEIKCTAFFSALNDAIIKGDMICNILIEPTENIWNGYSSMQGMMQGINSHFTNQSDYINYVKSLQEDFVSSSLQAALTADDCDYQPANYSNIKKSLEESDYSTLIIVENLESAENIVNFLGYDVVSRLKLSTKTLDLSTMGRNTLLLAPEIDKIKSKWYSQIYYISSFNHGQVSKTLSKSLHHKVQMVIMDSIYKDNLISIERLREIYGKIKSAVKSNPSLNLLEQYVQLNIKRYEMILALDIFREIGLLSKEGSDYIISTETTKNIEESKGYKLFS